MNECKNCRQKISDGNVMECPNCGATYCTECGTQTMRICPYCYSTLEFIG